MPPNLGFHAEVAAFNTLDWTFVIVLVWSVVGAFLRGFVREVFSLLGLGAGIVLASRHYGEVAQRMEQWIHPEAVRLAAAFLLITFGVMILTGLASRLLTRGVSRLGFGFVDRTAGAMFGLIRGSLVVIALLSALTAFFPTLPALQHSRLAPYFLTAIPGVSFVVPQPLQRRIDHGLSQRRL